MKVFLLYQTDQWLTNDSKELKGVYETEEAAIEMAAQRNKNVENESEEITRQLERSKQTFGYEYNYIIECWDTNESSWDNQIY